MSNPFGNNPVASDGAEDFEDRWYVVQYVLNEPSVGAPGFFFFEGPELEMPAPWERKQRMFNNEYKEVWTCPVLQHVLIAHRGLKLFTKKTQGKKQNTKTEKHQTFSEVTIIFKHRYIVIGQRVCIGKQRRNTGQHPAHNHEQHGKFTPAETFPA